VRQFSKRCNYCKVLNEIIHSFKFDGSKSIGLGKEFEQKKGPAKSASEIATSVVKQRLGQLVIIGYSSR